MINVVFASDDYYTPNLGICILSLLENNKDINLIKIYILEQDISIKNKNKILNFEKKYKNVKIDFIKTKNIDKLLEISKKKLGASVGKTFSLSTYSRLFVSSLLPKTIDKILYFDSDAIIDKSIKSLWNINITNYYCAGVLDAAMDPIKEDIGLEPYSNYINAGMLLINLKKWRENDIEKKFIDFLVEHENEYISHDQGVINGVLKNEILIVDPRYNFLAIYDELDLNTILKWAAVDSNKYYDKKTFKEAKENQVFIHFVGQTKNYIFENKKYLNKYKKYEELSEFKNTMFKKELPEFYPQFINKIPNKTKKINYIKKIIPKRIANKIAIYVYYNEKNKVNKNKEDL